LPEQIRLRIQTETFLREHLEFVYILICWLCPIIEKMPMTTRITLVHFHPVFLRLTEEALREAGFAVTSLDDAMRAWAYLKRGDTDLLIAQIGSPPGQPCGVALALGGRHVNPILQAVLLASPCEVEYAEGAGEILSTLLSPKSVAEHVMRMLASPIPRPYSELLDPEVF
jgi:hypothetical protein